MHDILKSYYKVASKRLVDVVVMQAVDYHLLSGPNSPLMALTPEWISTLEDKQLEQVAGEDDFTKAQREDLKKAVADLTAGKKILRSA